MNTFMKIQEKPINTCDAHKQTAEVRQLENVFRLTDFKVDIRTYVS